MRTLETLPATVMRRCPPHHDAYQADLAPPARPAEVTLLRSSDLAPQGYASTIAGIALGAALVLAATRKYLD